MSKNLNNNESVVLVIKKGCEILKLSVVIPIYNSEDYLEKCLKSIEGQTYIDFEVLMINDGSTDNSKECALKFSSRDNRFKYYEIINSGVSTARNYGINYAIGEYLTFVDSDDFLESNHFQLFMEEIEKYDLVVGGYKVVGVQSPEIRKHSEKVIFTRKEIINGILAELSIFSFPWNKVFRKDIIENKQISFRTDIHFGEDLVFDIEYAMNVDSVLVLDNDSYNYVQHEDSVSSKIDSRKLTKRMTDIDAMIYTINILGNEYFNEMNFLKERIAREGLKYWYLGGKYHISREILDDYRKKINPYVNWFFCTRKKDIKTLKLLLKYSMYSLLIH